MDAPGLDFCPSGVAPDLGREGCGFLDKRRGDSSHQHLWCQVGEAKLLHLSRGVAWEEEKWLHRAELSPYPSSLTCQGARRNRCCIKNSAKGRQREGRKVLSHGGNRAGRAVSSSSTNSKGNC